jgi:hypothetical protein
LLVSHEERILRKKWGGLHPIEHPIEQNAMKFRFKCKLLFINALPTPNQALFDEQIAKTRRIESKARKNMKPASIIP